MNEDIKSSTGHHCLINTKTSVLPWTNTQLANSGPNLGHQECPWLPLDHNIINIRSIRKSNPFHLPKVQSLLATRKNPENPINQSPIFIGISQNQSPIFIGNTFKTWCLSVTYNPIFPNKTQFKRHWYSKSKFHWHIKHQLTLVFCNPNFLLFDKGKPSLTKVQSSISTTTCIDHSVSCISSCVPYLLRWSITPYNLNMHT